MRRTRTLLGGALILLICPTLLARATDDETVTKKQAAAAIKEFKKFYANRNEHIRKAAVEDLGRVNHDDCVAPLIAALSDKSPLVAQSVISAIARQTTKPALARLTRILAKSGLDVKLAILESFKVTRPKVATETVIRLIRSKKTVLRLVATELLAVMPSAKGKAEPLLLEMTADSNPLIRLTAIQALVGLNHPDSADRCLEMLVEDKDWRVRATSMKALRAFRLKRSIEPLIDAMEREDGRLQDDAHIALQDITGFDYSAKVETWRRWWKRVKGRFEVPTAEEKKAAEKRLRESRAKYDVGKRDYTLHPGIKTKSKRMVFLLDISGSMQDKLVFETRDAERLKRFKDLYGDYETKIDLAREELINTVARLKPHVRFNIITFNSAVKKWKPKLVSATSGNRNAAFKFLAKLTPEFIGKMTETGIGQTNTFGAINLAMGLKNEPQRKPSKNHKVESDTCLLMTDGMPSVGRITEPDELLRYFMVVNRRAKIVFHTLTFGHGNEALLQPMAESSGGKYIVISVD